MAKPLLIVTESAVIGVNFAKYNSIAGSIGAKLIIIEDDHRKWARKSREENVEKIHNLSKEELEKLKRTLVELLAYKDVPTYIELPCLYTLVLDILETKKIDLLDVCE